ncbi:MAG: NTP transferase domain-containing protein [Synergistaceae bacterium]|jgi:CTP:molybdopterin cytidylyltransferase MocA|nr:NTP transferase domain-containing protein [Synergistaceae bacterium]
MKKKTDKRIAGLVLAGGLAERMNRCKVLLPLDGVSALGHITRRMRDSGVGSITVVTGGHEEMVRKEALRLGCSAVFNPAHESGMYSSVISGVKALSDDTLSFLLIPADIPLVKPATYRALIEAFEESSGSPDVVYPTFRGDRGHPVLMGRAMIGPIMNWYGKNGLRGLLADHPHRSVDVPTADRSILLDMDTPGDYEAMQDYLEFEFCPDEDECAELLRIAGTPARAVRHMRVVAECGMSIADALLDRGKKLNRRLLLSACLLHDLAKGEKYHEAKGAQWLRKRGYTKVAKLVASHKDLPESRGLGEAEILYLADKITDGETVSTLANRLMRMEARFPSGSASMIHTRRRIDRAMSIQHRVEETVGRPLGDILAALSPDGTS